MKKVIVIILASMCVFYYAEYSNASPLSVVKKMVISLVTKSDDFVKGSVKLAGRNIGRTTGGSCVVLARRIGCYSKKNYAAHHIIPVQLKNHRALNKIRMDMDEAANGIALPTKSGINPCLPLHRGSHPGYTAAVRRELDKIPERASVTKTREMVSEIQIKFRERLKNGEPLHEKYGGKGLWY